MVPNRSQLIHCFLSELMGFITRIRSTPLPYPAFGFCFYSEYIFFNITVNDRCAKMATSEISSVSLQNSSPLMS